MLSAEKDTLPELTSAERPFYDVIGFAMHMRGLVEEWQRQVDHHS
jgi:hypothetical protein